MTGRELAAALHPDLAAVGFRRDRTRWNRQINEVIHVVDVQTTKDLGSATVNIGVFDRFTDWAIWGRPAPKFVSEPACVLRTRLGPLIDGHDGPWWALDPASVPSMRDALQSYGLPWLDARTVPSALIDELVATGAERDPYPLRGLMLATLVWEAGDREEAKRIVRVITGRTNEGWRSRAEETLRRLESGGAAGR